MPGEGVELLRPIISGAVDFKNLNLLDLEESMLSLSITFENEVPPHAPPGQLGRQRAYIEIQAHRPRESLLLLAGTRYLINLGPEYGQVDTAIHETRTTAEAGRDSVLYIRGEILPGTSDLKRVTV